MQAIINIFSKKFLSLFLLGFSSGLPLALTSSTLTNWVSRLGLDIKTVGVFALVSIPYSCKFLWAPIFDYFKLPTLSRTLGNRRAWLLVTQILLIFSIIALGSSDPKNNVILTGLLALLVSFLSASQDILIDAHRIEYIEEKDQTMAVTFYNVGYRIAMLVSSGGALYLSEIYNWFYVYLFMAGFVMFGLIGTFLGKKVEQKELKNQSFIEPLIDMFKQYGIKILLMLLFIISYKLQDGFLSSVVNKLYVDLEFSNKEIAFAVKTFGFAVNMVGLFIGGILLSKIPLKRALYIGIILQSLSNLAFLMLIHYGHNTNILMLTIAIENFSGILGSTAFIVYLTSLCNINFSATQYALLSSIASIGRTFFASFSGFIIHEYGWNNFIIFTVLLGIIPLLLLKKVAK